MQPERGRGGCPGLRGVGRGPGLLEEWGYPLPVFALGMERTTVDAVSVRELSN